MAAFYADECFHLSVVEALRRHGHDVLTAFDAGQANQSIRDEAVMALATQLGRVVPTLNRRQFIALHGRNPEHMGIVVCETPRGAPRRGVNPRDGRPSLPQSGGRSSDHGIA